ncbi:partial glutamyl-tRNA synthetase, partial [Patescibacteria group bacterium]
MTARTRIAPSPTGLGLHIGHIRTMLYDYALAKNTNGQFIVRIEDTDQNRYVEGAVENILKTIKDYGLNYDEGPIVEGPYTPYVQSQRLEIYKKYALELIQKGYAYYCFLTPEETEELQKQARLENKKLRSPYRNTSLEEANTLIEQGKEHVVRLKVPEDGEIIFEDAILGRLKFNSNEVDDQILLKTDGFPTYHLAVVIDDYLMKITHVLRGNDWLSSTPKHILLYRYLGWELP